ncbi:hypothetical protein L873DRAFT_1706307, partial [Choiromyces venosus 120613-1]
DARLKKGLGDLEANIWLMVWQHRFLLSGATIVLYVGGFSMKAYLEEHNISARKRLEVASPAKVIAEPVCAPQVEQKKK